MKTRPETIPTPALRRIVTYLHYLRGLSPDTDSTSATIIANELGLNPVLVRKDLALVSSGGKPRVGYSVSRLLSELEQYLGYSEVRSAVILGAGNLGRALLASDAFKNHGFQIVAGFDVKPNAMWNRKMDKVVYPMGDLELFCKEHSIDIGIISVPPHAAQSACDKLVACGIRAIWNFTSINLAVPPTVVVKNEDLTVSLALLSSRLTELLDSEAPAQPDAAPSTAE